MELTPVVSSHVDAFGYFETERFLLIRFKGGALQGWLDFTEQQAADFLAAESKGQFLARLPNASVQISRRPTLVHTTLQKPLATLDEDAGKCCLRELRRREPESAFDCPDCGLSFEPVMVGPVRHFQIKPLVKVLR